MKKAVNAVTFISLALAASVTYNIVQHQRAKGIRPGDVSAPPEAAGIGAAEAPSIDPGTTPASATAANAVSTVKRVTPNSAAAETSITFKSARYDKDDEELNIDFNVPDSRFPGRLPNGSIELTPAVEGMTVYTHGSRIVVGGSFKPTTEYRVRVKKGLTSSSGKATLANDAVFDFRTPDLEERMGFLSSGEVYPVSYGQIELPFFAQNVKKFHAELYRAYENNLGVQSILWDTDYMSLVAEKDITLSDPKNKRMNHMFDAASLLNDPKEFKEGYYKLVITYSRASEWGGTYQESISRAFLLSDLAVVAMGGEESVPGTTPVTLAVRRISTGEAVAGARCEFLSWKNQVMATGETDAKGILTTVLNDTDRNRNYPEGPYAVTIRTTDKSGEKEFAWFPIHLSMEEATTAPNAFVFAERGILRPGETFQASAFIRERSRAKNGSGRVMIHGAPLKNAPVTLTVTSPDGKQFFTQNLTTDDAGFVTAPVTIPDTSVSGLYSIKFGLGEADWGDSWIRVGSYVPDRIRTRLEHSPVPEGPAAVKQSIRSILSADYYFGTPVPEATGKLYFDCSASGKHPDHWDGWTVGDDSRFSFDSFETAGTVTNGKAEFTLPPFESRGTSFDPVRVGIQASVQEPGGRSVTGSDVFTLYPSSWFIGLKQQEGTGKQCVLDVALLTPEKGKAADLTEGREISFTVYSRKWDYVLVEEYDGYRRRWQETVSEVEGAAKTLTIPAGADLSACTTKVEFDLPDGCYDVVAEYGSDIRTKLNVWHYAGESGRRSGDPSELVFKTDGTKKPGETAQITFNAPAAGEIFCVGSGADAGFTKEIAAGENTVSVTIPKDYQPGKYHLNMILVGKQGDEYVLSRGLASIPVDHTAEHKLNVSLTVPGIVRPESEADVAITLAAQDGSPSAGEVCLFAVDEGVLALTGFKTPDIYRHFFSAESGVPSVYETYSTLFPKLKLRPDGTIGGGDDVSGAALKASLLKMKESVRLIAPPVKVPASGSASVKVNIPDHSGSLRFMAVASADDRAGSGSREVIVRTPVSLTVSAPRVLAPGDEARLTIRAFNHDAKEGAVKFTLNLPDTLELVGDSPAISALAPGETKDVSVRVKALDKAGEGTISATLSVGSAVRTETLPITVRTANPPQTVTKIATVGPGKTMTFDLPSGFVSTDSAVLSVSASPSLGVTGALDWLNRYPYGCLEQTVSAAFPFLSTASLVKSGLLDSEIADTMAAKVPAAYARILPMMAGDGAFSMWPDVRKEWPEGTVYASHFIFEAEAARRITVDAEIRRSVIAYLLRLANSAGNYKPELRAYATYALAVAGNRDFAIPARNILAGAKPGFASFLASAALIRGGFAGDGADAFKKALSESVWLYGTSPVAGITDTSSRAGMVLDVIMKCDPKGCKAEATELAAFLAGRIRKDGKGWGTTQSNAWASMGLAAFAEYYPPVKMNGEFTFADSGAKEAFTDSVKKDVAGGKVSVANNGSADIFVQSAVTGIPKEAQATGGPVRLVREYFDEKGRPVTSLKHGELAFVRILADSPEVIGNIVISDILPAGLEIEDDALATRMDATGRIPKNILPKNRQAFHRTEKRDDRFLVFGTLYESAYAIYTVRAVTPGKFTIPAVYAEDMYDPDMNGTYAPPAGQDVFEVK